MGLTARVRIDRLVIDAGLVPDAVTRTRLAGWIEAALADRLGSEGVPAAALTGRRMARVDGGLAAAHGAGAGSPAEGLAEGLARAVYRSLEELDR